MPAVDVKAVVVAPELGDAVDLFQGEDVVQQVEHLGGAGAAVVVFADVQESGAGEGFECPLGPVALPVGPAQQEVAVRVGGGGLGSGERQDLGPGCGFREAYLR